MAERENHAPPDRVASKPQLEGDNGRLRQTQSDAGHERGRRRAAPTEHRSRGPEDETRNQPQRRTKD